jgi:hypothetical protein
VKVTVIQTRDGRHRRYSFGEFHSPIDHQEAFPHTWGALTSEVETELKKAIADSAPLRSGEWIVLEIGEKEKTPHDRGLEIRDNWINGNRSDAIVASKYDAAGAVCCYGALRTFEGEDEADGYLSALIRSDPNYR